MELNEECNRNLYVVNNGRFNVDFSWEVVPTKQVHDDVKLFGPDVLKAAELAASYFTIDPNVGYAKVISFTHSNFHC